MTSAGNFSSDTVYVGAPDRITGAIMSAPRGSTLPTDSTAVPDAAFVDSGYITEDGATLSESPSWTDITDWGGDKVRSILSTTAVTLKASFLEVNDRSAKAAFGDDNVTVTPATALKGAEIAIKLNTNPPPRKAWIVNMLDEERHARIVLPDAQVTERGDQAFTRQGALVIPVTISAYPDDDGNVAYEYFNDGVVSGP